VARSLSAAGCDLCLVSRTRGELESLAAELAGAKSLVATGSVSSPEDVARVFAEARAGLGGVDILVNGAGVAPSAPLAKTSEALWRAAIETNLSGVFYCMREALPEMMERGYGRIVNLASIAGKTGYPYIAAYAASKHGVLGLTKCGALEAAARGVTVNAVCPGYVDSPMTDTSVARLAEKTGKPEAEIRKVLERMSPQRRLFTAEEVASLVLYLCSEDARGITGQALSLDGGTVV
jgi:NAD(P)-dependent dehydrogenase (short-subunit alcohol dehydrogenase family)